MQDMLGKKNKSVEKHISPCLDYHKCPIHCPIICYECGRCAPYQKYLVDRKRHLQMIHGEGVKKQ